MCALVGILWKILFFAHRFSDDIGLLFGALIYLSSDPNSCMFSKYYKQCILFIKSHH